jgi:hypothetical protein
MGAQERAGGMGALLVEAGAIEALVRGMHRHYDNAKVQETVGKCMHLFFSVQSHSPARLVSDTPPDTQPLPNPAFPHFCVDIRLCGHYGHWRRRKDTRNA